MVASKSGQSTFRELVRDRVLLVLLDEGVVDDALEEREDAQNVVQALLHGLHVDRGPVGQEHGSDGRVRVLEDAGHELQVRPQPLQVLVFGVNEQGPVQHLLDFGEELLIGHFRKEVHDRDHHARVKDDRGAGVSRLPDVQVHHELEPGQGPLLDDHVLLALTFDGLQNCHHGCC